MNPMTMSGGPSPSEDVFSDMTASASVGGGAPSSSSSSSLAADAREMASYKESITEAV